MEAVAAAGLATYDLLDGGQDYKKALADSSRDVVSLLARRPGHLRVRVADSLKAAKRGVLRQRATS
jgi:CelD/BcsL family acetyltransferase involved in cellulose biosynthesis